MQKHIKILTWLPLSVKSEYYLFIFYFLYNISKFSQWWKYKENMSFLNSQMSG